MVRQLRLPYTACINLTITLTFCFFSFFYSSFREYFLIFLKLPASLDHINQHSILYTIRTPVLLPFGLLLQYTCKNFYLLENFACPRAILTHLVKLFCSRAKNLACLVKFVCPRALSMLEEQTITHTPGPLTSTEWPKRSGALPFSKGINTLLPSLISEIFLFFYNPLPTTALVETPPAAFDNFLVFEPPHFLLLIFSSFSPFFFSFFLFSLA